MPFRSRSQLGQCFSQEMKTHGATKWNCKKSLSLTANPTCLHYRIADFLRDSVPSAELRSVQKRVASCRRLRPDEKGVSGVHIGPRGGAYIVAGGVKVYVPKGSKGGLSNIDWAIGEYGRANK